MRRSLIVFACAITVAQGAHARQEGAGVLPPEVLSHMTVTRSAPITAEPPCAFLRVRLLQNYSCGNGSKTGQTCIADAMSQTVDIDGLLEAFVSGQSCVRITVPDPAPKDENPGPIAQD